MVELNVPAWAFLLIWSVINIGMLAAGWSCVVGMIPNPNLLMTHTLTMTYHQKEDNLI